MTKKEISYNDALAEIEAILAKLNDESLDIDTLSVQVKRATELISLCKLKLKKVENEVNAILDKSEEEE